MTPPTLVEPENDKIFERLHTARTAIPITFQQSLSSQTQHKLASIRGLRPTRGLPSSYPVFFVFFLCLCGFPGSSGSGSGYLARRQSTKKALCRGGSTAQGFFGLLCCFGPQRWPRWRSIKLSLSGSMRVGKYIVLRLVWISYQINIPYSMISIPFYFN